MSDCSSCQSCGAPIKFVRTVSGRWVPLDPEVVNCMTDKGHPGLYEPVKGFVSHFATCPDADKYRRARE